MAFNFQAYRNPYVSTIADLLSRGEDAKAKALVDVASAQARAAEARGQAYGGAIESVGKIVGGIPAQIQANKRQALNDRLTLANITQTDAENKRLAGEADDRAAFDFAGSPGAAVEEGFTGPLPAGSPMPTRDQTLARLPPRLRQQANKSYAELDESAQRIAASKAAEAENQAQTAVIAAASLDKQREYVSDLANQLRQYGGSMDSIQRAYDHAKNSGLDPKAMAQVDAMYEQLKSAPTDAERAQIVNTVPLHPNTQARNLAKTKEENDAAQAAATLKATEAQRLAAEEFKRLSLQDRADAREAKAEYKRETDAAKDQLKAQENVGEIAADEQKLYAALELRAPLTFGGQGMGVDLSSSQSDPEAAAALQSIVTQSGSTASARRRLTEVEFINAKNEIDKSIRVRYGLPPRSVPRYGMDQLPLASVIGPRQPNTGSRPNTGQFGTLLPAGGGMVRMIAPNGQEKDVPADQVAGFERAGAKRK